MCSFCGSYHSEYLCLNDSTSYNDDYIIQSSKNERKRPSVFEAYHLQHDAAKTVYLLEEKLKSGTEPELKHEISIKVTLKLGI